MPDYKLSKIYEIRCNITNQSYYGSTTQKYLSSRLSQHKAHYKKWLKNKNNSCLSSFEIIKNGDYKIILVENVECKNKDELIKKEQYYIDNNDCINKINAFMDITKCKIKKKEYYENNKDKINKNNIKYYEDNKDTIKIRRKKIYQDNKDTIKIRRKKIYQDNKDDLKRTRKNIYQLKKIIKDFSNIDLSIFE
jgi:hypothetical protein